MESYYAKDVESAREQFTELLNLSDDTGYYRYMLELLDDRQEPQTHF